MGMRWNLPGGDDPGQEAQWQRQCTDAAQIALRFALRASAGDVGVNVVAGVDFPSC